MNSVCACSVQDDVAGERQDEDVRGIPAGRDKVSVCVKHLSAGEVSERGAGTGAAGFTLSLLHRNSLTIQSRI